MNYYHIDIIGQMYYPYLNDMCYWWQSFDRYYG